MPRLDSRWTALLFYFIESAYFFKNIPVSISIKIPGSGTGTETGLTIIPLKLKPFPEGCESIKDSPALSLRSENS